MHFQVFCFLSNLFSSDMLIILFVALFLFGGEKLPELARGLGKGMRDFKEASESVKNEINAQINIHESKEYKRIADAIIANKAINNRQPEKADPLSQDSQSSEHALELKESVSAGTRYLKH